jgi:hypothetical protein
LSVLFPDSVSLQPGYFISNARALGSSVQVISLGVPRGGRSAFRPTRQRAVGSPHEAQRNAGQLSAVSRIPFRFIRTRSQQPSNVGCALRTDWRSAVR